MAKTVKGVRTRKVKRSLKQAVSKTRNELMKQFLPDEEVACRLVKLYFEEIARLGFKRKLDLDSIVNAYFYTLQRLKNKEKELKAIKPLVEKEEKELATETKEEMFPQIEEKKE